MFSNTDCGTIPAQFPNLILSFPAPFPPWPLLLSESIFTSIWLSVSPTVLDWLFPSLYVSQSLVSHSLFLLLLCMFLTFSAPLSLPDEVLLYLFYSLCLFISPFSICHMLSLLFVGLKERDQMSAGGTGQAVCLHLIITVFYTAPLGNTQYLLLMKWATCVLTHMNNTNLYMSVPNHVINFF